MFFIFENEEVLVVDKMAGVSSTNENDKTGESVTDYLQKNFVWARKLARGGVVHRLDKNTSGVLMVAKNQKKLTELQLDFKNRKTKKTYLALACGKTTKEGVIKVPLGKTHFFGKRGVVVGGREAETGFRLISYYKKNNKYYSLLELYPKTGRTHQIRVHCAYMGWPLVGDKLYGGDTYLLDRHFLHASRLEVGGKVYQSTLPAELIEVLTGLEMIK